MIPAFDEQAPLPVADRYASWSVAHEAIEPFASPPSIAQNVAQVRRSECGVIETVPLTARKAKLGFGSRGYSSRDASGCGTLW